MIQRCKTIFPAPLQPKERTVISSYSKAVCFGKRPLLIRGTHQPNWEIAFQAGPARK